MQNARRTQTIGGLLLVAALGLLVVAATRSSLAPTAPPAPTGPPASTTPPAPTSPPAPTTPPATNPLAGRPWYVDPHNPAQTQADSWRAARPQDAALMDKIARQPQADWFGDWTPDVRSAVAARVTLAGDALPVLVAYNIPHRDCGNYSAGGAATPEAYRAWITAFAAGLGSSRAVVILEPDTLPGMDCLAPADQQTRVGLIKEAVGILKAQPGVVLYVDAGHSHWIAAAEMARRLTAAGIAAADGFSLNVSNYIATPDLIRYGQDLAARLGGKHFVIDTSRNGQGAPADFQWCNPPGRGLGTPPTTATADPLVDAYLWIKRPGESDGTCNGGPPAGRWWPEGALALAQRAAATGP